MDSNGRASEKGTQVDTHVGFEPEKGMDLMGVPCVVGRMNAIKALEI